MVPPGSRALDLDSASDPPSMACFSNLSDLTEHERWPGARPRSPRCPDPTQRDTAQEREGVPWGGAAPAPVPSGCQDSSSLRRKDSKRAGRQPVSVILPEGQEEGMRNSASQPGREWPPGRKHREDVQMKAWASPAPSVQCAGSAVSVNNSTH